MKNKITNHLVTILFILQIFSSLFFEFLHFFLYSYQFISLMISIGTQGRVKTSIKVVLKLQKTWVEPSKNISYLDPKKVYSFLWVFFIFLNFHFFFHFLLFLLCFLYSPNPYSYVYSRNVHSRHLRKNQRIRLSWIWYLWMTRELYGDYGPLGIHVKVNIKNLWIREFVQKRKDMVLLDSATDESTDLDYIMTCRRFFWSTHRW